MDSSTSVCTIASGTAVCMMLRAARGSCTVTFPAPVRKAARVLRMAAPVIPSWPATRSAWPIEPLCAKGDRRRSSARASGSSVIQRWLLMLSSPFWLRPMSSSCTSPTKRWFSGKRKASLGTWMDSVLLARMMKEVSL